MKKKNAITAQVEPVVMLPIENWLITELEKRSEIPSHEVKKQLGLIRGKALTKKNFPHIRHKLYSFMTAYHKAMFRGGYAWISVIAWKT